MSARQWHKTSHRADSSGPHPRDATKCKHFVCTSALSARKLSLGIFLRAPKTSSSEKDMARARWPDLTKAKQNLSRKPLGSANYIERRSATAFYLSRPTDKNDAKRNLNGTANMFVSGPSFFTCVVAYTCLPEATVPKPQKPTECTAPIAS